MKRLNTKSRVMTIGFILGLAVTGLMACLVAWQKIGLAGIAAVLAIMLAMYIFGWYMGREMNRSCLYNMAWEDGYREGRIDGALEVGVPAHPNCRYSKKGR